VTWEQNVSDTGRTGELVVILSGGGKLESYDIREFDRKDGLNAPRRDTVYADQENLFNPDTMQSQGSSIWSALPAGDGLERANDFGRKCFHCLFDGESRGYGITEAPDVDLVTVGLIPILLEKRTPDGWQLLVRHP